MTLNSMYKRFGVAVAAVCLAAPLALGGCAALESGNKEAQEQSASSSSDVESAGDIAVSDEDAGKDSEKKSSSKKASSSDDDRLDLLVLVNKDNALPKGWEDELELVGETNSKGDYVEVDKVTYDAFNELKEDLEENEGITIELNSGYRSVDTQQSIWDSYMEDFGDEDMVEVYVMKPGYSEHHTGLALDVLLVEDGMPVEEPNDVIYENHKQSWDTIHEYLAKHGFILRYLDGKEDVTGIGYEPWHIRYVGVKDAKKMMDSDNISKSITLEEYLGEE